MPQESAQSMTNLPETVLQFGSGKFLRAFADLFIDEANQGGQAVGRVVVVQSTGDNRAEALNRQSGRYHVLVRGLANGVTVDRVQEVASVSRALVAASQWNEVLAVARSPHLRHVISNTAEVGYTLHPADNATARPPRSFPAKLLLLLQARHEAGLPGLTILPCELFEQNGDILLNLVLQLAGAWHLPATLMPWLSHACIWCNTLVDRIVVNKPADHPLAARDALLIMAEPFAFWAVDDQNRRGNIFRHPAILTTRDVRPYFLRKVRILNAAHTALVNKAMPRGLTTVRQAVLDPEIAAWLERLLFDEIVPTLEGRVDEPAAFAHQVLERFRNPFLEHKLSDIAVYHDAKVKIRLVPTREEFTAKFGREPKLLTEVLGGTP
jgi:tagaturonate reductase